jgi:hypothetical protein
MRPLIERMSPRVVGVGALLCLDAGLIAFGWAALSQPIPADDAAGQTPWAAPALDARSADGKKPPAAADDPIVMRPVFFASRKPFEPAAPQVQAAAPAAKPPPPPPTLVVDGIVLTAKLRKAHLRRPTDADGQWHEVGQVIEGWTVAEIDGGGVVLESTGRRFPLRLYPTDPHPVTVGRAGPGGRKLR